MTISRVLVTLTLIAPLRSAAAVDWPMWRHDPQRSAATAEELPEQLHLQWSRQLPAPMPAWPNETRLHFDSSYEPIVLGSRLFVGSMADGGLTAFDCTSGEELWRFYSDGPIRLAPVAFGKRVCFGSDDGHLYCLDTQTGKLIWKIRGAPDDRPPYRHLGNARLISFWPVRGGPVYADGVVYFGAGIWPTLGVFVRAVDAQTGKILWTNDDSHAIADVRVDHNYAQESGISPQGHMLVQGDMLIVPNGRSMPARIDRKTGKLHYFVQGYRNGDSRVTLSGDIALVGRTGVVSLKDGREIASRWAAAGKDAPEGWSSAKVDLFEGPLFPYRFQPACDHRSAIHGGIAYGIHDGTVFAYDLKAARTSLQKKQFNGKDIQPARWDAPELWQLTTDYSGKKLESTAVLKAGTRLYSHAGRNLFAVSLNSDRMKAGAISWQAELPAEPTTLLAANDRLFAVTRDGAIHCFGEEESEPTQYELAKSPAPVTDSAAAKAILDATGKRSGYAIVAGLRNGALVRALLAQSDLNVIAIDDDSRLINDLRQSIGADNRFQALVTAPGQAELPPYLASLIVTESSEKLELMNAERLQPLYKALRPYGGTLCVELDEKQRDSLLRAASPAKFAGLETGSVETLTMLRRSGPLPGSSPWSHETGDAARSFYSKDGLVMAPLAVLWYGDGRDHGFYKRKDYGHGLKPQVAGGRLVALQVATNTLKSVDAYTGRLLWSRKVGGSARYVSMPDTVYVADERSCLMLDPDTGDVRSVFAIDVEQPAKTPVSASDMRVGDDIILIAVRFNKENAISKGRWNSTLLVALDRTSGKQLWSRLAKQRYNTAAIAVSGNRVFCIDSHSPEQIGAMRRRGADVSALPSTILALDTRTGQEIWKVVRNDPPAVLTTLHFMGMRTQDDWLAVSVDHNLLLAGKANQTFALNVTNGAQVWQKAIRGQQPLILGPETFINQTGHTYKVASGDLVSGAALFRRGGCNYAVGGKNLLFLRSNCATYVDIGTRKEYAIRNLRSGCSNSLVAADGLLNAPCFSVGCVCNYPIQTSFAMFHMPESAAWHGDAPRKQPVFRE